MLCFLIQSIAAQSLLPSLETYQDNDGHVFVKHPTRKGIRYSFQSSGDMLTWTPASGSAATTGSYGNG